MNENLQALIIIVAIALSAGSTVGLMIQKFCPAYCERLVEGCVQMRSTWKSSAFVMALFIFLLFTERPDEGFRLGQAITVFIIFGEAWIGVVLYFARPRGISKRIKRRS